MTENQAFDDNDTELPDTIVLSKKSPLYRGSSLNDQNQVIIPPPPPGIEPNVYQRMLQNGTKIVFDDAVDADLNNNPKAPRKTPLSGFFRKKFKSKKSKLL